VRGDFLKVNQTQKDQPLKTYPQTTPLSTRESVEMITASNARHAAAPPLELAVALERLAAEVDRLAEMVPEVTQ
jgi:hypothetical protein